MTCKGRIFFNLNDEKKWHEYCISKFVSEMRTLQKPRHKTAVCKANNLQQILTILFCFRYIFCTIFVRDV